MSKLSDFLPDWASPPGDTLADLLLERSLSEAALAQKIGCPQSFVQDLLCGQISMTSEIAVALEKIFGSPSSFWLAREAEYRADVLRLSQSSSTDESEEWLRALPLKDMLRFGWLSVEGRAREKYEACLRFFDVPSVRVWQQVYGEILESAAFKTTSAFTSNSVAVAAWLRQGEREAADIHCLKWDVKKFRDLLPDLRALTRQKDPSVFLPTLRDRCAECGVAVSIVRAPAGCRASGATRFVANELAIIQLSFRYLSEDHFWFAFFHEAGHLVLHGKRLFLESDEMVSTAEEQEANEFAAQLLIPYEYQEAMHALPVDGKEIIRFARKVGVSPGIVVGQLQHIGHLAPKQMNSLKRRFRWD